MERKNLPRVPSPLRDHIVEMPQAIFACTGVVIHGRRIKSLVFSTDIAIIRNCNADAVLAVYPFTPQNTGRLAERMIASVTACCGVNG